MISLALSAFVLPLSPVVDSAVDILDSWKNSWKDNWKDSWKDTCKIVGKMEEKKVGKTEETIGRKTGDKTEGTIG